MLSWQAYILKNYMLLKHFLTRPPDHLDIPRDRLDTEALARMFRPLVPLKYTPVIANGVPAEWITPQNTSTNRVLLYLHGGSFNSGSIVSHRSLAGNVAAAGRARALIIDYRLSPEFAFPAALDDVLTAYQWLLDEGYPSRQLVVAGDSAGGTLGLALLIRLRDERKPLPASAVLLSPATDLTMSGESWVSNAKKDVMLKATRIKASIDLYLQDADPRSPLASPLFAQLGGIPPVLIQVGSNETLLSDATRFAEKAKLAGIDITLEIWPEMQHEWQFAASFLPEGKRALKRIGEFIETTCTLPA